MHIVLTNRTIAFDPKHVELNVSISSNRLSVSFNNLATRHNIDVQLVVSVRITGDSAGIRQPNRQMANTTSDLCRFLAEPLYAPFGQLIYKSMQTNPQNRLFRRCPIQAGGFHVRDFMVDSTLLPAYLPNLAFTVQLDMFADIGATKRDWLCSVGIYGLALRQAQRKRAGRH